MSLTIRLEIANEAIELISGILGDLEELTSLIPESNIYESKQLQEKIKEKLAKLVELKRILEGKK